MCNICGMIYCPSGCPGAKSPEPKCQCEKCYKDLYEGDNAYEIDGKIYCDQCIGKCAITVGDD